MTVIQNNVAEDKLGHVLGFTTMVMGLATPIGIAVGGVVAEAVGVAPFFAVDGVVCAVLGLLVYMPRCVRELDHAAPEASRE